MTVCKRWSHLGALVVYLSVAAPVNVVLAADPIKVSLAISGEDPLRSGVESFIGRELRALGDIAIATPDNADIQVRVLAVVTTTVAGQPNGFALSVMTLRRFKNEPLMTYVVPKAVSSVRSWTSDLYFSPAQFVVLGATDSIQAQCRALVVQLDAKVFENVRAGRRLLEEKGN